ncbi:MAG: capsular biosynthesis protein [Pseudomonadota bacterium]
MEHPPSYATDRRFLFLQGPHGPFFAVVARHLRAAGCQCFRVGFNAGDRSFWPRTGYLPFRKPLSDWPDHCADLLRQHEITDLVVYGDTREIHAEAIALARARGITVHIFEEGYLRPHWVTYERNGANGQSPLAAVTPAQIKDALGSKLDPAPDAPARWGDLKHHVFYGALYHLCVWLGRLRYPHYHSHRNIGVVAEFRFYFKTLMRMPLTAFERRLATARIKRGGFPYHLVLLQLPHDASFRDHSEFTSIDQFLACVVDAFADGAPAHHRLVFKAHPLEDGRVPLKRLISRLARKRSIENRVNLVHGGKLARLLDTAQSAVTVNSTAAQQALWRGLPLKAFGRAVYCKPGLTSDAPLASFFADPTPPEMDTYRLFRQYMLETSQVRGGFYARRGRQFLTRQAVDLMLQPHDRYAALASDVAAPKPQLQLVNQSKG